MNTGGIDTLRAAIRRSLPLMIGLIILGILAVNLLTRLSGAKYQATAQVEISATPLSSIVTGTQPAFVDPQRVQDTAQALAGSRQVYELAHSSDPSSGSVDDLQNATSVAAVTDTDIISFSVTSSSSAKAIQIANGVSQAYVNFRLQLAATAITTTIAKLQNTLSTLPANSPQRAPVQQELSRIQLLQGANASDAVIVQRPFKAAQTSPAPAKDSILGFSIGLIVALLVVALREAIDTSVRSEGDVEELLGAPVLASVRSLRRRQERVVALGRHETAFGDTYTLLAAQITIGRRGSNSPILAVTSALASEGKTSTAANLAVAAARRGADVILADFDFRKPAISRLFDIDGRAEGALQVLDGSVRTVDDLLWAVPLSGSSPNAISPDAKGDGLLTSDPGHAQSDDTAGSLWVLPSGGSTAYRSEQQTELKALLTDLRDRADIVILDTPPALLTVEMTELAQVVDGVIIVVRHGRVTQRTLRSLGRRTEAWRARVLGAVFTDVPSAGREYGRYYGEQ